jgi:hypothetical protein
VTARVDSSSGLAWTVGASVTAGTESAVGVSGHRIVCMTGTDPGGPPGGGHADRMTTTHPLSHDHALPVPVVRSDATG